MKPPPEDGSLEEITSSGLNHEINVIIIRRPDEIKKPGETTYTLATFDRTKEGEEWPGDEVLEKLIPELPKVKVPVVSKPEVPAKTNTLLKNRVRRKHNQKPVQKDNNHRPKPPHKKFHSERSRKPPSVSNIEPWVHKPWEKQAFFSVNATSLTSEVPFNTFQQPFPPRISSNNYNFPNNSAYERNMRPTGGPNIPILNNHHRPPLSNRIPSVPCPSFPPPTRYTWPSNRFCSTFSAPNVDFTCPPQNSDLFTEGPIVRHQVKKGLLGDSPVCLNIPIVSNMPHTTNLLPRDEGNIGDQNSFISNTKNNSMQVSSYDGNYGRIPEQNFDNYADVNEISIQNSRDSYEHPNSTDDSRNDSFRDTSETNYSRFLNSGNSVDNYENQYWNNYKHLDHNYPNDNNNIFLKTPRDSYNTNYVEFEKPSAGVSQYESDYMEIENDDLCENNYNECQMSSIQETSFMNNLGQNPEEESFIHVNNSTIVYNQRDFQNDGFSVSTANSSSPGSNPNLVRRLNRPYIRTKNTQRTKKQWTMYKNTNNRQNRGGINNKGPQRFNRRRRPFRK
ncbi:uncharacterized protein DDB_G0287625-like [Argiope bruennichi]|uniref:Uncharacterized protein n=1 Tax=Argiope bruennichi TaxID=94029 RepID=A0A8T0EZE0_ARGBR|nr:uncharacterized protein DDB_G0287625-like [Argiope bruennichi]XP_055934816.1 uncharacterized protein DDB_G0287625-like [Argiope bruennichi]XP_055934817.1 uncharacterized protein DDB_G0287625-like [Argiope bruennichi]KAF8782109.1 hypothetical protein HNY73_012437 [Argiope bruennichi]